MKNIALSIASGLLLAFAWPTDGYAFLLFIAFVPLLLAIENIVQSQDNKKGFKVIALAYLAFVIWNFYTTWWLRFADFYAALFAVLANSLLLSLVIWTYYYSNKKLGSHLSLVFLPLAWISFESFHQNWDLSWPWLNLGNGFSEYYKWIQWYEYTGIFGGTLWVWMVNISIFKAVKLYNGNPNWRVLIVPMSKVAILIAAPIWFSLSTYNNYTEQGEKIEVAVLQPNLDPYTEKFNRNSMELAQQLLSLSENCASDSTVFVFGPETSLPGALSYRQLGQEEVVKYITQYSAQKNLSFITGATLIEWYNGKEEASKSANYYGKKDLYYDITNSAILFDSTKSLDIYNKSKLVVGVEHMPFRDIIQPILGDFIINLGGTVGTHLTQDERSVFRSYKNNVACAPIICYESVYGDFVTGYVKNGAGLLAVITNDGWWGNTQGHKQHLSFSRLRAIENRRSVARSANTGISAIVNQRGDIVKSLPYNSYGSFAHSVSINQNLTVYSQYGDYLARVFKFIAVLLLLYAISKRKSSIVY